MGQVGPRTELKCRIIGTRFARGRSSMIMATLSRIVPLYKDSKSAVGFAGMAGTFFWAAEGAERDVSEL